MNPSQPGRDVNARSVFAVIGVVEHGDHRGRQIGFPTANLPIEQDPGLDGVWAGCADVRGDRYAAAISIGNRPTIYGREGFRLLEAHLLDFDGDLYGELLVVWMCRWLRGQQPFPSLDELACQLAADIDATRDWSLHDQPSAGTPAPRLGQVIRIHAA